MHNIPRDTWPLPLAGPSPAAGRARTAFAAAIASATSALIVADRGLDVESIATAIHDRSRPGTPLIVIDCGAADAQDVERGLFGARRRGTAHRDLEAVGAASAFLRARAGTVYLKQVVELPAATQRRLSRILRDREVSVAGKAVAVHARVIGDAPASVAVEVDEGHFRSDLFRRLAQTCIAIPGLRERPEDIPALAARISAAVRGEPSVFTQAALTVLSAPAWPGNLDELRAVLERVLDAAPAGAIRQEDVLAHLPIAGAFARIAPQVSLREARRRFERQYIAAVLEQHDWRMSNAARTLGIERANLYRKTRQLGIARSVPVERARS